LGVRVPLLLLFWFCKTTLRSNVELVPIFFLEEFFVIAVPKEKNPLIVEDDQKSKEGIQR